MFTLTIPFSLFLFLLVARLQVKKSKARRCTSDNCCRYNYTTATTATTAETAPIAADQDQSQSPRRKAIVNWQPVHPENPLAEPVPASSSSLTHRAAASQYKEPDKEFHASFIVPASACEHVHPYLFDHHHHHHRNRRHCTKHYTLPPQQFFVSLQTRHKVMQIRTSSNARRLIAHDYMPTTSPTTL